MNNIKKQLSRAVAFFLIALGCAIAEDRGESQEGSPMDPVKQIEELRKEADLVREKATKAPPSLSKKLFEIAQTNEKIAMLSEKKIKAIKENNSQKIMQIQRDIDKLWQDRARGMDESRKEFQRYAGKERDRLREQARSHGGRSQEGKSELATGEKLFIPESKKVAADRSENREKQSASNKQTSETQTQEWPAYE